MSGSVSRNFSSIATIVSAVTLHATSQTLSNAIDLATVGYEGFQVTIDITWHASGTENVRVDFYGSLDGTDYDDVPYSSVVLPVVANTTKQYTFIVWDYLYTKIGLQNVASDANGATITSKYRAWNRVTA